MTYCIKLPSYPDRSRQIPTISISSNYLYHSGFNRLTAVRLHGRMPPWSRQGSAGAGVTVSRLTLAVETALGVLGIQVRGAVRCAQALAGPRPALVSWVSWVSWPEDARRMEKVRSPARPYSCRQIAPERACYRSGPLLLTLPGSVTKRWRGVRRQLSFRYVGNAVPGPEPAQQRREGLGLLDRAQVGRVQAGQPRARDLVGDRP